MKINKKRLDKLLSVFNSCDYLYAEVNGRYCKQGIFTNEPSECGNCKFKTKKGIKEWLKEE